MSYLTYYLHYFNACLKTIFQNPINQMNVINEIDYETAVTPMSRDPGMALAFD